MFAPTVNQFALTLSSVAIGTQPTAALGAAVTPGNLTYGSFVQMLAATSDDSCEVEIGINSVGISATARDCLITVAWDTAGGTSYGVAARTSIPDLLGSAASPYCAGTSGLGGGVIYRFLLRIPAGSTIAAKAMVNSATLTAVNVYIKLRCRPTRPDLIYVGSFVDTYGVTLASASGTAVTPGVATRGSYVSLGALTQNYAYFEVGMGCNDSTMSNFGYEVDVAIGDASNKDLVIESAMFVASANEVITKMPGVGRHAMAGPSSTLFARVQASGTPDSNISVAVYAVGG